MEFLRNIKTTSHLSNAEYSWTNKQKEEEK